MSIDKKLLALIASGALIFGGAVLAQDQDGDQNQDSQTQQPQETQVSTVDVEHLRMALSNLPTEISELEAISGISSTNVQFVDVGPIVQSRDETADAEGAGAEGTEGEEATDSEAESTQDLGVADLISQNQQQITALHEALEANGALQGLLANQNIAIDNVVAIEVTESGQVIVFYAELEPQESEAMETQPETVPLPEDEPETEPGDDVGGETGNDGEDVGNDDQ